MLKAKNRLRKRKQFAYIYRKGKRVFGNAVTIFFVPSKFATPLVGFSVNNTVGKAVVRNKIKRRLREIIYPLIEQIKNVNFIISVKPEIVEYDFEKIKTETEYLLKKAQILS